MLSTKPILVTGMPRSGTTWVGRMIAEARFVRYVHEPLNPSSPLCRCGVKFDHRYSYISAKNAHQYYGHLKHTIYPAYNRIGFLNFMTGLGKNKRLRSLSNYLQSYLPYRPVMKDPTAVFSAVTLADLFHMDVVVVIRHPAAIVSSYKALNWTHPFSHFLNQPELMEEHLASSRSVIEEFAKNEHEIVDQAALLWKLIYQMVIDYQKTRSKWFFVQHEHLALDPIEGYRKLFDHIKLPFSDHTRQAIQAHALQQLSHVADPYAIKQDPLQVTSKWKRNLTSAEIYRIREQVEDVSSAFFTDEDWDLDL